MTTDQRIGYPLAAIGLLLMVVTAGVYLWQLLTAPAAPAAQGYLLPLFTGIGIAWWGFAWAKPRRARENGQFVRDVVDDVRGGRRGYDPTVPPVQSEDVHHD